jgi:hypothetical protein
MRFLFSQMHSGHRVFRGDLFSALEASWLVILSAKGRIEEARGRLAGAPVRFRDNPLIELDAGPRFIPERRIADVELGFSQNFELGGRRNARIAGAESGIARETATSEDVTRRLLRDVATAFLRSLWAEKRLELLRSSEQLPQTGEHCSDCCVECCIEDANYCVLNETVPTDDFAVYTERKSEFAADKR